VSKDRELLVCLVEEHVMLSSAELWFGGKLQWRISHGGEEGPKGLSFEGEPPPAFGAIRREQEEAQMAAGAEDAGVDYIFEIPLQVAQAKIGFKHDEICPHLVGAEYAVLTRTRSRKGFLARLLGD